MRLPVIRGLIDRRILVNYRVDPEVLARMLPTPFQPKLVDGAGMAGVCLIRLKRIRPKFIPGFLGISSENTAHRISVEWGLDGRRREGVFIPRRDTSSRLNSLAGGRVFPGEHHHARFQVNEQDGRYQIIVNSDDCRTHLVVAGHASAEWPKSSVFASLEEASRFFERGSLGYSTRSAPGSFDGLELRAYDWQAQTLAVERLESSFFEDLDLFPPGSARFDCALLMRGIEHEWRERPRLCSACIDPAAQSVGIRYESRASSPLTGSPGSRDTPLR
jgi:hypothetical protein